MLGVFLFSQEEYKPYYISREGSLVTISRDEKGAFGMILLIVKKNYQLSIYIVRFWMDK